jgi:riboflavin synthase
MFTGIIECLGTITLVQHQGTSIILQIKHDMGSFPVAIGGSVAIDGTCLTLEQKTGNEMRFCAVAETLRRTTLYNAAIGRRVNLERALLADGRLDGHFVYGHVDGIGTIIRDQEMHGSTMRTVSIPEGLSSLIAEKGSVAVDGISLTVAQCTSETFAVSLIPKTLSITTMFLKKPGEKVNVEGDIIARYLKRIFAPDSTMTHTDTTGSSLLSLMERSGF